MQILKSLFKFYINSSIHVALSVVSLTIITFIRFDVKIDLHLLTFIFLATISGYNFVKYAPVAKLYHRSLTKRLKVIQFFSFLCGILLFVSCFYIKKEVIYLSIILGLLNMFYAIPAPKSSLREIPLLKIFVIAVIWATTTVCFPFIYVGDSISFNNLWVFELIERFFLVVLLMVPFEVRDYPYDRNRIVTIISSLGLDKTKKIALFVIVISLLSRILMTGLNNIWVDLLIYSSLILVIVMSNENQRLYFASFWVESLPIFWLILSLFFI